MTSPAYVFHATGAVKALLDQFCISLDAAPCPMAEMFAKRACYHYSMSWSRCKICSNGYKTQSVMVKNFKNRNICRRIDERYSLRQALREETKRVY